MNNNICPEGNERPVKVFKEEIDLTRQYFREENLNSDGQSGLQQARQGEKE
jgi:hypothetical protein